MILRSWLIVAFSVYSIKADILETSGFHCKNANSMKLDRAFHGKPHQTYPPFEFSVIDDEGNEVEYYEPGENYKIRLVGYIHFRGFMLQSRLCTPEGYLIGSLRGGRFILGDAAEVFGVTYQNCDGSMSNDSLTHSDNRKKFLVEVLWTTDRDIGAVQFLLTVAVEDELYWERWRPRSGFIRPKSAKNIPVIESLFKIEVLPGSEELEEETLQTNITENEFGTTVANMEHEMIPPDASTTAAQRNDAPQQIGTEREIISTSSLNTIARQPSPQAMSTDAETKIMETTSVPANTMVWTGFTRRPESLVQKSSTVGEIRVVTTVTPKPSPPQENHATRNLTVPMRKPGPLSQPNHMEIKTKLIKPLDTPLRRPILSPQSNNSLSKVKPMTMTVNPQAPAPFQKNRDEGISPVSKTQFENKQTKTLTTPLRKPVLPSKVNRTEVEIKPTKTASPMAQRPRLPFQISNTVLPGKPATVSTAPSHGLTQKPTLLTQRNHWELGSKPTVNRAEFAFKPRIPLTQATQPSSQKGATEIELKLIVSVPPQNHGTAPQATLTQVGIKPINTLTTPSSGSVAVRLPSTVSKNGRPQIEVVASQQQNFQPPSQGARARIGIPTAKTNPPPTRAPEPTSQIKSTTKVNGRPAPTVFSGKMKPPTTQSTKMENEIKSTSIAPIHAVGIRPKTNTTPPKDESLSQSLFTEAGREPTRTTTAQPQTPVPLQTTSAPENNGKFVDKTANSRPQSPLPSSQMKKAVIWIAPIQKSQISPEQNCSEIVVRPVKIWINPIQKTAPQPAQTNRREVLTKPRSSWANSRGRLARRRGLPNHRRNRRIRNHIIDTNKRMITHMT